MAEMDIYMRRRLVALGGLVAFFIIFVLLVKSCGGDEEPEPVTTTPAGATGETGAALTPETFIQEADPICESANLQVSKIDPAATDAAQQEFEITSTELEQLQALPLEPGSDPDIDKFLSDLSNVVAALRAKAKAADVTTADAAQLEIDTAEVEAREQGEKAGFSECGQFLDAGQEPASGGGGGGNAATDTSTTDTGGIAPTDTGTETPPTDTATPPTDTVTPTDPADTGGGGGITP